ncbi:MAG: hypothetical protein ACRD26_15770 [Vicinamibacterales bacterium]
MRFVRAGAVWCVLLAGVSAPGSTLLGQSGAVKISQRGPQVGEAVPPVSGRDQFGRAQTLETMLGAKGAMLVFFRSADW